MAFCNNCKKTLNDDNKFCPYCGKEVKTTSLDVSVWVDIVIKGKPEEYTPVEIQLEHLNRVIEVKIPNIIKDNQNVCLRGLGMVGTDGTKGNLYILPRTISYEHKTTKAHNQERKVSFEGEIRKCPQCGELIKAFMSNCPSCGYELRGVRTTSSVHEFAKQVAHSHKKSTKEELIRNFYIPNTKEDIIEFFILAVSNIETDAESREAWASKLEQTYQKARFTFGDTNEFKYIEQLYNNVRKLENKKKFGVFIAKWWVCLLGAFITVLGFYLEIMGNFKGASSGNPDSPYYMLAFIALFIIGGGGTLFGLGIKYAISYSKQNF